MKKSLCPECHREESAIVRIVVTKDIDGIEKEHTIPAVTTICAYADCMLGINLEKAKGWRLKNNDSKESQESKN
ncbi:MAG: hypothetical protein KGJ58_04535 [Patescibacteria group bacterium]|nr:hypothetical protein [Patescibacteria group bacterium]